MFEIVPILNCLKNNPYFILFLTFFYINLQKISSFVIFKNLPNLKYNSFYMACLVSAVFLVCFVDKLFSPPYYLFGKMFPPILRANLPLLSVNGKTNLIIIFMLIPRTCCCCCCWSVFVLFMALLIRQRARGIRLSSDGRRCGLQFDGGDFATWRRLVH